MIALAAEAFVRLFEHLREIYGTAVALKDRALQAARREWLEARGCNRITRGA